MQKNTILTLLLFLSFSADQLPAQTNGGPDLYGYTWKDSNDPTADHPVYAWKDITSIGTRVTDDPVSPLSDENSCGPFNIGWSFYYYTADYDKVKIGANGWVSFKTNVGNVPVCLPTIPQTGGIIDNYLAPFMTDLIYRSAWNNAGNVGEVYYWSNNLDTFIVSYINVPWWKSHMPAPDWIGSNSFQLVLSGRDSSVTFCYKNMDHGNFPPDSLCSADIIIGMESPTGTTGLQQSIETIPGNLYAIKFFFPENPPISNEEEKAPSHLQFCLSPNPICEIAIVEYELENTGIVNFEIANAFGQTYYSQEFKSLSSGRHSFQIDASDFSPGLYFVNMIVDNRVLSQKMIVTR